MMKAATSRIAIALAAVALAAPSVARDPDRDRSGSGRRGEQAQDRASRAEERAARDASRAQERSIRDTQRLAEDVTRDQQRYVEERAKILKDTATDPVRQAEELAKLDADLAEDQLKAREEAAKVQADLAEELVKVEEDRLKDLSDAAEDMERATEDRAEELAETGSSAELKHLGDIESPEADERGYPVRRGEVVAIDLSANGLEALKQRGFRVISQARLDALDSEVIRLAAPSGMEAGQALKEARALEPAGTFDFTHYYGMQFSPSGKAAGKAKGGLTRRNDGLNIGMIDTAVAGHPSLRGTSINIRDFAPRGSSVPTSHGTAVASILISEGTSKLWVANIFRGQAAAPFTSADAIVNALEWMVENKVPVVNMSLAGPRNAILDRLVNAAVARGTMIVAAAGNGGPSAPPAYPAALRPVVAVTAVDDRLRVYRYANQGRYITVAAAGVDQPAADATGGISLFSGTSFATPLIAAWMGRCLKTAKPADCARTLRLSAQDLGEPGYDPVYGYGLIRKAGAAR
jgi:subtilisin family serine protease